MDVFEAIETRRSVRHFTGEPVTDEQLDRILDAGRRAPSGLNNQPWRFIVVRDPDLKDRLAQHTHYDRILREADALIVVLIDNSAGYSRDKDMHGLGACMQTMWLAAHALGLGLCWNGQILNSRAAVEALLEVPDTLELMAVLCIGCPVPGKDKQTPRKSLDELVIKRL